MTSRVSRVNGSGAGLPTLLGRGPARIPTSGKIRAGIKVLTRRAAESPVARDLYERGLAAGHSFERIEKAIAKALPDLKRPSSPRTSGGVAPRARRLGASERRFWSEYAPDGRTRQCKCYESDQSLDPERKRMFMPMKREVLRLGGYEREFFVSQTRSSPPWPMW